MSYFIINFKMEDKRLKTNLEVAKLQNHNGNTGRPNSDFIKKFTGFNYWFSDKHFNHGNIVAHLFDVITDQINVNNDKRAFGTTSPNGRSCNKYLSRGLYFPSSIIKDQLSRFNRGIKPKNGLKLPWGYYLTGLLYIWKSKDVLKHPKNYIYYGDHNNNNPLTSYNHNVDDPAHELRFTDRAFVPPPAYLFVGKSIRQFRHKNRIDIKRVVRYVKKKYPSTIVVYTPHIWFGCNKKRLETGNKVVSMNAQRIMEIIFGIELGWYEHLKREI